MSMEREVDETLLAFAKSDLIDPDESSAERAKARNEYMKGLNALYPQSSFRAPRRRRF